MAKRSYPLSRAYGLLEPGPVLLMTTAEGGRANVMTLSWTTMMEFEPPLVGCVIGGRHVSFAALTKTRECVLNIPTVELAPAVVGCGNVSGRRVNKFRKFGLTPVPARMVAPPLIDECYASLECRLADRGWVNRYSFFVLEVVKAWVEPGVRAPRTLHHRGRGVFAVASETLKLPSRVK